MNIAWIFTTATLASCIESPKRAATDSCPSDLPSACQEPAPSFANDVQPIFSRLCWQCHTNDGIAVRSRDFSTYELIFSQRSAILNQFYSCNMPPEEGAKPTADERATLLRWLVCDAPNN